MKQNLKRSLMILFIIYIFFILYSSYNNDSKTTLKINLFSSFIIIGCVIYIIFLIVELFKFSLWRNKEMIKSSTIFILVSLIILIIPTLTHFIFFRSIDLNETDIMNFYGNYITFLGTFGLGYVVYQRDKIIRMEKKLNKAKLLHASLDSIIDQMNMLDMNPERVYKIEYNLKWKEYYFEVATLKFKNEMELRLKLEYIFKCVDDINYNLEKGEIDEAKRKYKSFIKWEQYWPTKFNFIETRSILYEISYLWGSLKPNIPWDEKIENKQNIEIYGEQFFYVIENWICNYMLKYKIDCLKTNTIIYDLVDFLMVNNELNKLLKTPYDKRIVSAIVTNAKLKMNEKSNKLNYYWDEFTFKKCYRNI